MEDFFCRGQELIYPVGSIIFKDKQYFYRDTYKISYIISGEVSYLKKSKGNKYLSFRFGQDDLIGIEAGYNNFCTTCAAMAVKPVRLYQWYKDDFDLMIGISLEFAVRSIVSLSRHLRKLNQIMTDIMSNKIELTTIEEAITKKTPGMSFDTSGEDSSADVNIQMGLYNLAFHGKDAVSDDLWRKFGKIFNQGDIIFKEGEAGEELFLILEGSVTVSKEIGGTQKVLAILQAGDIFGEMAIFEDKPRSATIIAYNLTKILALNISNFKTIFQMHPSWPLNLVESFAKRINHLYVEIEKFTG